MEFNLYLQNEEKYVQQIRKIQTTPSHEPMAENKQDKKIVVKQLHDLHDKMEVVDPEYVNLRRGKTIVARELK